MRTLLLVVLVVLMNLSSVFAASWEGRWESHAGAATFHDPNRGPIAYENCELRVSVSEAPGRLEIALLTVDCNLTEDLPFSHEFGRIQLEIRDGALLENGQKVGSISEGLVLLDYPDQYGGMHYLDFERKSVTEFALSWSYRGEFIPGFDVTGDLASAQY